MPTPYSEDLRLPVVMAVESGKTTREVGALYQVSPGFVSKAHQLWKNTGGVQSKPIGGYRRALLEPYEAAIKEQLTNSPLITLRSVEAGVSG
jgi:transposase